MNLSDMRIGTKLMAGFILVLLLATAQGLLSVVQIGAVNDKAADLADHWLPSVRQTGAISTQASRLRALQFQHVLTTNEDEKKVIEKAVAL